MSADSSSLLTDLQTPDEMALVFNPIGFGGRMEPAEAARFQQSAIASAVPVDAVPDQIRQNFERARRLHLYGVLEYEFFTAASDYALLVLESALRVRFLSHYDNEIPVSRRGQGEALNAESFDDVRRAPRSLQLRGSEGTYPLPLGARALLGWARRERLLPGSETRRVDHALGQLRNYAAHPEGRTVLGPPDSARTLRDVAEVVNALWGHRVPGGRLFPAPVARMPRVASIATDGIGAAEMGLHHVPDLDPRERESDFAVFLAAEDEKLTERDGDSWVFTHRQGLQRTVYPCEQLWAGTYMDLVAALEAGAFSDCADTIEHLDRLFFVRVEGEQIDEPRSTADLLAFDPSRAGRWHAVTADSPYQAFSHVKNHGKGKLREESGSCPECFVRTRGVFGDSSGAIALARSYGAID
ncbi:MAG TPA: hypothetical protein VND98_07240 [Solirubrobacterales bacterium]|nr:hypothetical protein [Solirubrobacterales bacterium]